MTVPKYASDYPRNHTVRDYTDPETGLRILVRVGFTSFCAYVGVQADHSFASLQELDFDCHWGITFRDWGQQGTGFPENWYWWGWDYAHCTDATEIDETLFTPEQRERLKELGQAWKELLGLDGVELPVIKTKRWTVDDVYADAVEVMAHLKEVLRHNKKYCDELTARLQGTTTPIDSTGSPSI